MASEWQKLGGGVQSERPGKAEGDELFRLLREGGEAYQEMERQFWDAALRLGLEMARRSWEGKR